ncbi:putative acyltransferase [Wenxinia marina DSM 24838]|uniref:Putative acyltransferase n=1 Tax=Wenxinia marina DSM 24838 TaxID=1123501 RepID=A0A0D0PHN1_9RHOB|nr:putative acyltransferase [Wenxinia marina DSM 24838]
MRQIPSDPDPSAAPAPHLPYRPEIDGLRAIAVLSVVLYHFGVPGLTGGFVGVDVFFVISGFLIGGLLWKELAETGRLRIGRFYLRRIRRLAPAFFAMALASAVVAALVLLPFEFREFGKELIAATLWLSNVLFWRSAGYFDTGSESKVLLHTWSLSVEEQFYLVLPVTLLALWWLGTRFPRGNRARTSRDVRGPVLATLALLWTASLLACIALTPSEPVATFFLFPFRAWELLTGVLLAIHIHTRGAPRLHPALPWAGLALILAGVLLIRADGFPGWQALLPTIGTALVLAATGPHPVLRALAHPVPVFVGLISYSLYLWHWPVLILSRYWRDGYSGPAEAAAWLALAILLAILSWAFVERPVRRARALGTPALLSGAVLAGGAALGLGGLAYVTDGLPVRFGPDVRPHILASQDFLQDWSRCTVSDEGPLAGIETCALGPQGPPEVVVWGDSHLRALMDGLALAAVEEETPGLLIWHAGCPPLFGLTKTRERGHPGRGRRLRHGQRPDAGRAGHPRPRPAPPRRAVVVLRRRRGRGPRRAQHHRSRRPRHPAG